MLLYFHIPFCHRVCPYCSVKCSTDRSIKAAHDLSAKTFRLRSKNAEVRLLD